MQIPFSDRRCVVCDEQIRENRTGRFCSRDCAELYHILNYGMDRKTFETLRKARRKESKRKPKGFTRPLSDL